MESSFQIPTILFMMALQREEDALAIAMGAVAIILTPANEAEISAEAKEAKKPAAGRSFTQGKPSKPTRSTNSYEEFYLIENSTEAPLMRIVTVTLAEMGPHSASAVIAEAIHDWHPGAIFLLGICAGIPDGVNVRLGDIVVGSKVVDRDSGKIVSGELKRTFPTVTCDEALFAGLRRFGQAKFRSHTIKGLSELFAKAARKMGAAWSAVAGNTRVRYPADVMMSWITELDHLYKKQVIDRSNDVAASVHDTIRVHVGTVLSGATVIKSISHRRELVNQHADTRGIEMEGAGLAAVLRRVSDRPRLCILKGICDFADETKDDRWQQFAAATSAIFVLEYLLQLDENEIRGFVRMPQASSILRYRAPWHYNREGHIDNWRAKLIGQIAEAAADECDMLRDGRYCSNLSQSRQYILRARALFQASGEDDEFLLVTALERVSRFWFRDIYSRDTKSFIDIQPPNTTRLFVFRNDLPTKHRVKVITDQLNEHIVRYEHVFITNEQVYIDGMKSVVLGSKKVDILKQDFAVKMKGEVPTAIWWLERESLSARDLSGSLRVMVHDLPIHLPLFVTWMQAVKNGATGIYKWSKNNEADNDAALKSAIKRRLQRR